MQEEVGRADRTGRGSVWSRRGLLAAGAVAGTGALTAGLSGCSGSGSDESKDKLKEKIDHPSDNLNKAGFPVVNDPISVQFMTSKPPSTAKDYNKVLVWKQYEKMTKIKVDWGLVSTDSIDEKRNLALTGRDYPEVFYASYFGVRDLGKYGDQGVFVELNDLIDKYMPNLKKLMGYHDELKQGMTFPDGSIYGAPLVIDPDFTGFRIEFKPWVRGDWLDKFDMEVPTTTKEYYHYLKTVKSKQPNGKEGAIPYGSSREGAQLYSALRGAFGVGNRGQSYVDANPDDASKVRFFPSTEAYKALMEYLHRLYAEGLIAKNIFSIDPAKAESEMKKGRYGSTVEIAPEYMRGGQAEHFVPMGALKGPEGHRTYNNLVPTLMDIGRFIITDKCKHPVEVARWADYFYSEEGARFYFMGVKGKTYEGSGGGLEYFDKIKDPKSGLTQDDAKKPYFTYLQGGYGPTIIAKDYFKASESSQESTKAAKVLEPDAQKEIWSQFTFTEDEFQQLDSLSSDIEKYVDESRDKFISGDFKLSDWDTYMEKIKKMGLDDYMEIQQAAYDRYRKD